MLRYICTLLLLFTRLWRNKYDDDDDNDDDDDDVTEADRGAEAALFEGGNS